MLISSWTKYLCVTYVSFVKFRFNGWNNYWRFKFNISHSYQNAIFAQILESLNGQFDNQTQIWSNRNSVPPAHTKKIKIKILAYQN
jgi:hypothetical protein